MLKILDEIRHGQNRAATAVNSSTVRIAQVLSSELGTSNGGAEIRSSELDASNLEGC